MLSTLGSIASQGGVFPLYIDGVQNVAWTTYVSNASYASVIFNPTKVTVSANGWYKSSTESDEFSYGEIRTTQDVTLYKKLCVEFDVSNYSGAGDIWELDLQVSSSTNYTTASTTISKTVHSLDISAITGSVAILVRFRGPMGSGTYATGNIYKVWLE